MGEKMMTLVELRDAIAKAIADAVGDGMREKYERHAEAALTVVAPQLLLTAKNIEAAHLTQPAQAVDVADRIRAKLPAIRASTGNLLFDAGTHDACEKIEALLAALSGKQP